MAIEQNFLEFRESISQTLTIEKDRVRNLIGSKHWLTDGAHKESILRKVIRSFAPEIFHIGHGFVCYPTTGKSSTQLDILISSKHRPTLYQDGDLKFLTSNTAEAVIEVKTKMVRSQDFVKALKKLADALEAIRNGSEQTKPCWGGLFLYDHSKTMTHKYVLDCLQKVAKKKESRVINCVSIGTNFFVRFWPKGHPDSNLERVPMWHSYNLGKLAQSYFIGNIIFHITPDLSIDDAYAWFPIPGTKETYRAYYAKLNEKVAYPF